MSDERMSPLTDAEKVRLALEYGSEHTPALTREPVFVWTNAEAALDRLESQNQALQERIEEVAGYAVQLRPLSHEQALILPKLLQLVSPTQETPFAGTLDETIAYLKDATQETDPDAT